MWIQEGQEIEVQGIEDGFYGAWFPTIVLKTFDEFVNENDNSKHLCGMVQISQIKLIPPNINNTRGLRIMLLKSTSLIVSGFER